MGYTEYLSNRIPTVKYGGRSITSRWVQEAGQSYRNTEENKVHLLKNTETLWVFLSGPATDLTWTRSNISGKTWRLLVFSEAACFSSESTLTYLTGSLIILIMTTWLKFLAIGAVTVRLALQMQTHSRYLRALLTKWSVQNHQNVVKVSPFFQHKWIGICTLEAYKQLWYY